MSSLLGMYEITSFQLVSFCPEMCIRDRNTMSIHEECGVFGAIAKTNLDIGNLVYYGLYALQHLSLIHI